VKQVVQNIGSGSLKVQSLPDPVVRPGCVLIANAASLISAGTERMVQDLAKKSLLGKARERPDQVRRVLEKIRNEGLFNTIAQVRSKLDEPMKMGYASAGVVLAAGDGVQEYKPGDRVASNGPHAEIVSVPANLCARVPDNVPFDHAAFTVLGAVALQGVRLARLSLGETAFVVGLGLLGQIAVALLKASGCRVIGADPDPAKCELARRMGAEIAEPGLGAGKVKSLTRDAGADAVLIAASTKSNEPIATASNGVRKKGRIVLLGVVGLELDRRPLYFSEAEFVVSCSYGPGRYDPEYEDRGRDYPLPYVRWTEQRNMQAVLDLMAQGKLDVAPLITHRFPIEKAEDAYKLIEEGKEPYVGILLEYPRAEEFVGRGAWGVGREQATDATPQTPDATRAVQSDHVIRYKHTELQGKIGAGVVGAGNYARATLLPNLEKTGAFHLVTVCDLDGLMAGHSAQRHGADSASSDASAVIRDPNVQAVFILTRHSEHARLVMEAIKAGKNVFVEKPLALTVEEIAEIEKTLAETGDRAPLVTVGFNRRFSPVAITVREFMHQSRDRQVAGLAQEHREPALPLTVSIRFNAGAIPPEHWTQDDQEGGGRIIGEACHAIDLATFLCGSPPVRVFAESVGGPAAPKVTDDQAFITLRHANGSISSIAYLAGGDKSFPKERVEVIGGGRVAVIDDFKSVTLVSGGRSKTQKGWSQDKGHRAEIDAFAAAVKSGGPAPIPWADLRAVSLAAILAVRSLREGFPFEIPS
jgi:predicted dehydrogenase/threonine dehydrogenase-like Zn-dependent dehydrogenase